MDDRYLRIELRRVERDPRVIAAAVVTLPAARGHSVALRNITVTRTGTAFKVNFPTSRGLRSDDRTPPFEVDAGLRSVINDGVLQAWDRMRLDLSKKSIVAKEPIEPAALPEPYRPPHRDGQAPREGDVVAPGDHRA